VKHGALMKRLFRHAHIAREDSPELLRADVLVEAGSIAAVESSIDSIDDAEVIDCTGCILLPSLFDMHVHAREPGREEREDIHTCSEAAIHGGFTGMVLAPNTLPAVDSAGAVQNVLDTIREKSRIWQSVLTAGAITKGRKGEELAGIAGMKARGVAYLTDDADAVANPQVLRRAMEYARQFELPIASYCDVKELSGRGTMHEGRVSYALGLPGIPAISEEIAIARDIRLAHYTGVHLHIQHVSTREGMETICRAKERGIRVTCEVTPHHLLFNHEHLGNFNTQYKVYPPLRTEEDNAALLDGLRRGCFDVMVTDHAPHTEFEKNQDFASAPFGITGLETALPALYQHFIKPGKMGWDVVVKRFSAEPRRLMKQDVVALRSGSSADFVVFNPQRESTFTREFIRSKSINTPFFNQSLEGRVERVIYRGKELLAR
jgi:dihydroorotase